MRFRKLIISLFLLGGVWFIIKAFQPVPVKVELVRATRGPLTVTIDEEAKTRVRDIYTVTAPVSGYLSRITFKEGDHVAARKMVARIDPLPLAPRERTELIARVGAVQSAHEAALAQVAQVRPSLEQAERDLKRARELFIAGVIPRQQYEQADSQLEVWKRELKAAEERAHVAAYEIEAAKAGLLAYEPAAGSLSKTVFVYAPISAEVLRIFEKSERVVSAGTPLLELGDTGKLEIVIEALTTDAQKLSTGATVLLESVDGTGGLKARIRTIERSAFTKISALGVEEQRVNIVADFVKPPECLGNGFRLDASIVLWHSDNTLKVPVSALFRQGENWAVFIAENGRARLRAVSVGQRGAQEAEVTAGLAEGLAVILYPSDQLIDGTPIEQ